MADLDAAVATQLSNIEKRTGKSLEELHTILRDSGLARHTELLAMLKGTLGMGHGDANLVVHLFRAGDGSSASNQERSIDDVLGELYTGPKAALRPIHERLLGELASLGEFEWVPKKGYISYRRNRQFAMIGPATNTRVELGLNMKGIEGTERLQTLPPGQMCNYKVKLTDVQQVDAELASWVRVAYESAG